MRYGDMSLGDMNAAAGRHWESMVEPEERDDQDYVHCYACGDRPNGCPRCADESGVK